MITAELVLETLQRATSQQVAELKAAEALLAEFETKPGFYSLLLSVISNHNVQPTVRWMASLIFKNGVDRYWRKSAPNAISEGEKQSLRSGLLCTFQEPVNQVAIQVAVLIAKAARFDFPHDWPDLVTSLVSFILKGDDQLAQQRALLVLLHVTKTLASKRLPRDRKIFHDVTVKIYSCILSVYKCFMEAFFHQVQSNDPECHRTLEKALLTIRILRKLSIHGFFLPSDSQELAEFVNSVFVHVRSLLQVRKSLEGTPAVDLVEKTICHLMKVLIAFLDNHPVAFVPYIKSSLELTVSLLFSPEGEGLLFAKFVVQCMNMIKRILSCVEYQVRVRDESDANSIPTRVKGIREEIFTPAILTEVCNSLITRYMPLTQEELEMWDSDPEEFEKEDVGESLKYKLRSSAEMLYVALFRLHREVLTPVIIQLVRENYQPVSPFDLTNVRRKDAVYLAVGLAAFDLYDEVDIDEWFTGLVAECTIKDGHYRIIRRRACWLLGEWSGVKLSKDLRPTLYQIFLTLLDQNEDMAVRLTAAKSVKKAIDDFEFDAAQFSEYVEPFVSRIFHLLKEAKECETKVHVLTVLSFIVERVGADIRPHIGALMHYLPLLWEESSEHNLLRCSIVSTLAHSVRALVTSEIMSFMCPVLETCLDMSQEAHMYLMEDGLELWLALLEYSVELPLDALQLLRFMPNILETTTEYLEQCCLILQAYIVLSPSLFFSAYGDKIFSCLESVVTDCVPDGLALIYDVVELAMRTDAEVTLRTNMPLIQQVFLLVYEDNKFPRVLSAILPIMSRVLLHSMDIFGQIVRDLAQSKNEPVEEAMNQILKSWNERMPLVTKDSHEKLLAMALTSLINVDSPVIVACLPFILRNIVQALNDITDVNDKGEQIDTLVLDGEAEASLPSETEHEARLKKLCGKDPVYKIRLKDYFAAQMSELVKKIPVEEISKSVDEETLSGLKSFCL